MRFTSVFAIAALAITIAPSPVLSQWRTNVYGRGTKTDSFWPQTGKPLDQQKVPLLSVIDGGSLDDPIQKGPTKTGISQFIMYNVDNTNKIVPGYKDFPEPDHFWDFPAEGPKDFVWDTLGCFRALEDGVHRFCTDSDDGSKLFIDVNGDGLDELDMVVNNDFAHSPGRKCGNTLALVAGKIYPIRGPGFETERGERQMIITGHVGTTDPTLSELVPSMGMPTMNPATGRYDCRDPVIIQEINE